VGGCLGAFRVDFFFDRAETFEVGGSREVAIEFFGKRG